MIPKSYKKNIAEGKGILIFALFFAILIRIIYYSVFDVPASATASNGYVWNAISPLFENSLLSLIGSSVFTILLAIILIYINNKFTLIRTRTLLPPTLCLLLFSCHPSFIIMSPAYIGVVFFLLSISTLFASYNGKYKQGAAFSSSFTIVLGSLFSPILLIYIPIFWIGLGILRCFNFKAILASLFSLIIVYFPALSFYLYLDRLDLFLNPFVSINAETLGNLPVLNFTPVEYGLLGFSALTLCIILIDNYINHYKDKIRIRAYLLLLSLITVFAGLLFILLNITPTTNLYICLIAATLLFSHFFALAESRRIVFFFYFCLIIYLTFCILSFLPLS